MDKDDHIKEVNKLMISHYIKLKIEFDALVQVHLKELGSEWTNVNHLIETTQDLSTIQRGFERLIEKIEK